MIWRLRYFLFGTHFIALRYCYDDHVRRIQFSPGEQRPFVKMFDHFIWLDRGGEQWEALTFDKAEFLSRYRPERPRVVESESVSGREGRRG